MTKIGTEVDHVTRDSDTTFKVKKSKVNLQGAGEVESQSNGSRTAVESKSNRSCNYRLKGYRPIKLMTEFPKKN